MIQGPIITDMVYRNFVFKYQGNTVDKIIYEVYPTKEIEPSDFINEIIYNDKTRFNLSLILNKGISDIKGYITIDEGKTYKMVIEVTIIDEAFVNESIQSFEAQTVISDFYPLTINDVQYPYSSTYYKIFNPMNIEENYLENKVYMVNITLTGLNPQKVTGDDIYDAVIVPLERKLNIDINPTENMKIQFDKLYFATIIPMFENSFYYTPLDNEESNDEDYEDGEEEEFDGNLSGEEVLKYVLKWKETYDDKIPPLNHNIIMNIYFKIDKINDLKLEYVSSSKLVIENDDAISYIPENIVSYFYHSYCIYRERTHKFDVINSINGRNMRTYTFTNMLCLFTKVKVPEERIYTRFLKSVFKKEKVLYLYKSSKLFDKTKYCGYVYDINNNFNDAIDIISKHEIFKNYNITLINETENYAFIMLVKKDLVQKK